MCGIVGFTNIHRRISEPSEVLKAAANTMQSRGPDEFGYLESSEDQVYLGHRRLSIIGLQNGKQPLHDQSNEIHVIANGEIYNYPKLKEELISKGYHFRTQSDCEVLVHLYKEMGIDFVNKIEGMYAFAIWDSKRKKIFLVRDRFGKKPIYYSVMRGEIYFASELKALLKIAAIKKVINTDALKKYFAYDFVPAPYSIINDIHKVDAGQVLVFDLENAKLKASKYWMPFENMQLPIDKSLDDVKNCFMDLLERSVKKRLMADVPVGVFLSGGLDSSTIAYLVKKVTGESNFKTFSISFEEKSFDESSYAQLVAKSLATDHYEERLSAKKMLEILPRVGSYMDEPFADASIIPTYLLSQFAHKHVKVVLGGDGADELLLGYPTFMASQYARIYEKFVPDWLNKKIVNPIINSIPVSTDNISIDFKLKQFIKGMSEDPLFREQVWLGSFNSVEIEDLLVDKQQIDNGLLYNELLEIKKRDKSLSLLDINSHFYISTYMKDGILHKIDYASMANSLEVRSPFLDHELGEFLFSVPSKFKLRNFQGKWILKEAMKEKLPRVIISRPKKGFGIPIAKWFKNELKDELLDTLSEERIRRDGFFNFAFVNKLVQEHIYGRSDNRKKLWSLFMFHKWLDNFYYRV